MKWPITEDQTTGCDCYLKFGVRWFAQGHFNMLAAETGNETYDKRTDTPHYNMVGILPSSNIGNKRNLTNSWTANYFLRVEESPL